ncbi:hypothetical protein ACN38_g7696 [Penicillium nordicum]|uniref:Uncharacterized protein n=1 Tax=Penicillium nordicum TaxID=229535 RepID=A0A0M8P6J6_9EURO|nr:hypothetical protein ACN38_g7696 [Penicillium nordicum]
MQFLKNPGLFPRDRKTSTPVANQIKGCDARPMGGTKIETSFNIGVSRHVQFEINVLKGSRSHLYTSQTNITPGIFPFSTARPS